MFQMKNPVAPASARVEIGLVGTGSFVRDLKGRIFFLALQKNDRVLLPVLTDGTIAQGTNESLNPSGEVDVVASGDLGIKKVKYAPRGTRLTHWR